MSDFAKEVINVTIEEELKQSYLDYAMSVIVGRALPDVRDGLKPVHRRVLFAMHELNNDWNKPYKKSARVAGDVIGKYHPHGEVAVYDAVVRLTQPFSMRYPLIDGQGNFGSVDGDAPAAMRYTEVRMSRLAHELLSDLEKETVDFVPNYDGTEQAPTVLPTRIPNLLVNGSSGIAVGMATNIPPHNLTEIVDACIALVDNSTIDLAGLMQIVPGPDFPTAGIIIGRDGILEAYRTGRGRIYVRARTEIETDEKSGKQSIIITELPYQVNKAFLLEKIAELVKEKKVEGITELRDESDKDGMRVVIELRRGEVPEVLINQLYSLTQMQTVFGINMVALTRGQPRLLNLKQLIEAFIQHRREVITRRSMFELRKARERAHILEGLGIALANIEDIIALIKGSKDPSEAKQKLLAQAWKLGPVQAMLERVGEDLCRPSNLGMEYGFREGVYRLSPEQAQAILDLRLHRLTNLEQEKILGEYQELVEQINALLAILSNSKRLMEVLREELVAIKEQFGDKRRTEIISDKPNIQMEDLITDEQVVVTFSHQGYAKIQALEAYQAQHRGGKGKSITTLKDDDFIAHLLVAKSHDTLLCFSNTGKVYWLKAYELPQGSRLARGKPIVNILPFANDEQISAVLPLREYTEGHFIFMCTAQGIVKKVPLQDFSRPRANGIIALGLNEGDRLIGVALTTGEDELMLFSNTGKAIRFPEKAVRAMGRTARGVRGIKLKADQKVMSLVTIKPNGSILTVTENGYGKRTAVDEYRVTSRGGQGVINIQVNERNGSVVSCVEVSDSDEVILISDRGTAMRTGASEISVIGRNTQGVRLMNLSEGEHVVGLERIVPYETPDETPV